MKKAVRFTLCLVGPLGFSLIELLVVISVISLLLGITVPTFRRARSMARQAVCQSQLRQWGLAFEIYATINDGYYPHIDGRDRCGRDPKTREDRADYYFGWVDMLPPLMGEKPWRDHKFGERPGIGTIFQCPSARLVPNARYKYDPYRVGFFSYAMNSCLELDDNCWPPYYPYEDPSGTSNAMPSFLRDNLIRFPSSVILLFDQLLDPRLGYGGNKLNRSAGKYCGSYPRAFSARHSKPKGLLGGFILYCDYHVGWKESVWKNGWPADLEVPPRNDPDWFPYP